MSFRDEVRIAGAIMSSIPVRSHSDPESIYRRSVRSSAKRFCQVAIFAVPDVPDPERAEIDFIRH
jgi:hypothetical protein